MAIESYTCRTCGASLQDNGNGTAIATVNLVQKNPCAECEARQQESMRKLARRSVERRGAAMMDAILGVSE